MEIKIQCGCGSKYKFDVEPVNGRMPFAVNCPTCGVDGVPEAERLIAARLSAAPAIALAPAPATTAPPASLVPTPPPSGGTLRINRPEHAEAPAPGGHFGQGSTGPLLSRKIFFVKERVAILKLTDTFDILDPVSGQNIGIAKEEPPGWAKWLRLLVKKQMLPTVINIYEDESQPPVVTVKRGFTFLRAKLRVIAADGQTLGYFRSKLFSIGGGFHVLDNANQQVAEVKGNWKGWDFTFMNKSGREIGKVTKKWAGLGRELFTSADNYIISLSDLGEANPDTAALLLSAGLAIDVVFKEKN